MAQQHALSKLLPLNFISYILGVIVRIRFPQPISWLVNGLFVSLFRIDMEEAEYPMVEYDSIEGIFTRALAPGQREIEGNFVSPADGTLSQMGSATDGRAVQAKGLDYSLESLAFGDFATSGNELTSFATVYLAPHNYHRVHSPCAGTLTKIRYIPGELWPVNEPFVRMMPRLFVRNERLVFEISLESGAKVYAVMVGALNVGRIETPYLKDFAANEYFKQTEAFEHDLKIDIKAGDELGTFMLGSTVVMALDEKAAKEFDLPHITQKRTIRMGESLLSKQG